MLRPAFQRLPLLVGEVVTLINALHAAEAAGDVIEELFDHRQLHAELGHAGRHGAPEIVQRPRRDRRAAIQVRDRRIERALGPGKVAIAASGRVVVKTKSRALDARKAGENRPRPWRDRDLMLARRSWRAQRGNVHVVKLRIELAPAHAGDFFAPLASQDQKLDERPERIAERVCGPPDQRQLGIAVHAIARHFRRRRLDAIARRGLDQCRARWPS